MRSVRLTRGRVSAATAAVAGISSAVAMLALDPAVNAASTSQSWAAGVAATGPVSLPPTPMVSSSGATTQKSMAKLPANQALSASVLHVWAGPDHAKANVADLDLGQKIDAGLVTAECKGGTGDSKLAGAFIDGHRIPVFVAPNTTIAVPPGQGNVTQVVLNKQVPDGHGGIEVTAIEVSLNLAGVAETVDVSQADCAGTTGTGAPPSAPAPKPKQGTLPVTG